MWHSLKNRLKPLIQPLMQKSIFFEIKWEPMRSFWNKKRVLNKITCLNFLGNWNYAEHQFQDCIYVKTRIKIYLQLFVSIIYHCHLFTFVKKKKFSTTSTSYLTTGLSVKSRSGVTFVDKCIWLVYMICLTNCFSFFLLVNNFSYYICIIKVTCYSCFNFLVPLPFIKLGL